MIYCWFIVEPSRYFPWYINFERKQYPFHVSLEYYFGASKILMLPVKRFGNLRKRVARVIERDTRDNVARKKTAARRTFHLSSVRARALRVDVKTKKWSALLCAGETATQRLRALYVAVPMCGHERREGYAREDSGSGYYYYVYCRVYVHPRQRGGGRRKRGRGGEKNTPSYLVHFYPLKQFQHCFKIVLSRVIVLCMRPRSSGLGWCARTLDSSRTWASPHC